MAEFCNKCTKEMFGDVKPDIDVVKLFEDLVPESFFPVVCEGCGMLGVGNRGGDLILAFEIEDEEDSCEWIISDINEYKN